MKKVRLLLVGFGPRGKIWAKAIKKNSKTELVGICDINKDLKDKNLYVWYYEGRCSLCSN